MSRNIYTDPIEPKPPLSPPPQNAFRGLAVKPVHPPPQKSRSMEGKSSMPPVDAPPLKNTIIRAVIVEPRRNTVNSTPPQKQVTTPIPVMAQTAVPVYVSTPDLLEPQDDELEYSQPQQESFDTINPYEQVTVVKALYDYNAQDTKDLSFKEGDYIRLIDKSNPSGWWEGELNGQRGLFPSTFVEDQDKSFYVRATYDYVGETGRDLNFRSGDKIRVVDSSNPSGWWKGETINGVSGFFPSNFVQLDPISEL